MSIVVNSEERKAMKAMIVEMTHCLGRIEAEKEQMKDIASAAEDKFEIKKKFMNKMARTMFKHNYKDVRQESEHFELLYESIVGEAETEAN